MKVDFFKEDLRQAAHLMVGIVSVLLVQYIGFNSALLFLLAIFIVGLVLSNFKLLGGKVKLVDYLLSLTDRNDPIPGKGAMFFAAGILFLLVFAKPLDFALAMILLHAAGDAFATVIGLRFKQPLPWNNKKSWFGFTSFIVFGAVAAQFFIPLQTAFLYAFFLAIVESLNLSIDDNISVPVFALLLSKVV